MFSIPESKSRETWLALAFRPQDWAGSTSIFCTGVKGAEARGLVGEVAVGEVAPTTSCSFFSAPKADNRASRFLRISSWSGSLIPALIISLKELLPNKATQLSLVTHQVLLRLTKGPCGSHRKLLCDCLRQVTGLRSSAAFLSSPSGALLMRGMPLPVQCMTITATWAKCNGATTGAKESHYS